MPRQTTQRRGHVLPSGNGHLRLTLLSEEEAQALSSAVFHPLTSTALHAPMAFCHLSILSGANLPVLTEVTFRQQPSCFFSLVAVFWTTHDISAFSFGQFARLIEAVGHVREVTVFTIKPLPQHVDCRLVRSYYSA